jgi:hypothetical protein
MIKLLFLAFQSPPPCPCRFHSVAHSPSCPLSIPVISSPPPPCHHPCGLLRPPCCCAAISSRSLDLLPPPCNTPLPVVYFSSWLPLFCRLVVMSHIIALPPPCITFCCAAASCVHPLPPAFICTCWLPRCISSRCLCPLSSRQHCRLLTHCHLASNRRLLLLFASRFPRLVAALPHV